MSLASLNGFTAASGNPPDATLDTRKPEESGSLANTNSIETKSPSMSDATTRTFGSNGLEIQGASVPNDLFGLLISQDMCPPTLKESTDPPGWKGLVSDLQQMYKEYLVTTQYRDKRYKCMTHRKWYFSQQFSVSFGRPGVQGNLVTLEFAMNTNGRYLAVDVDDEGREEIHQEDDEELLKLIGAGRRDNADEGGTTIGDALRKFPSSSKSRVNVYETDDGSSAWLKTCSPGSQDDDFFSFYGVIDNSGGPTFQRVHTAPDPELDSEDEAIYGQIKRSAREESGEA